MRKKKLIASSLSKKQAVDLIADVTLSLVTTLPAYLNPVAGLMATGSVLAGKRIGRMFLEVQEYIKTQDYPIDEENSAPYRKLLDTLQFLSKNPGVDEEYIDSLRNLHIISFSSSIPTGQLTELWFLLEITRKLSAIDILIILTAYRISNSLYSSTKMKEIFLDEPERAETDWVERWARFIQKGAGFSQPDFVYSQQDLLEELHLISPRVYEPHSANRLGGQFKHTGHCRLTESGNKLAEYIIKGNELFDKMIEIRG